MVLKYGYVFQKKLQNQKKGDKIGQKDSNYYLDEGKNIL